MLVNHEPFFPSFFENGGVTAIHGFDATVFARQNAVKAARRPGYLPVPMGLQVVAEREFQ